MIDELEDDSTKKICPECKLQFRDVTGTTVYCTEQCRRNAYFKRKRARGREHKAARLEGL